jgi:PBP1b-binding outer membrane lipoprotein LpoB
MKFVPILLLLLLVFTGCTTVQYGNAAKAEGSKSWGPKEIKITVNRMVSSLYSFLKKDWKKPALIEVKRIRNRTGEHIETRLLADEIVTHLLKKRIRFIDRRHSKAALKEMEKGMTGLIDPDSAIPVGHLKSPNFYLSGDIVENRRTVNNTTVQYLVVTLRLTSLSTSMLEWSERVEFFKSSEADRISF